MWTVYILRIVGTNEALYVGATSKHLLTRLMGHRSESIKGVKYKSEDAGERVSAKAALMDQFRAGLVNIEIIGLRTTERENEARHIERALVEALQPKFNTHLQARIMEPLTIAPGERMLRYKEAAAEFGYAYNTIRVHVCHGDIRSVNKRIPYSEMQRYVATKLMMGRPRKVASLHARKLKSAA